MMLRKGFMLQFPSGKHLNRRQRYESVDRGVTMGRWSWGAKPVDLNNDGYEDLVVANGYFTNKKPDDL